MKRILIPIALTIAGTGSAMSAEAPNWSGPYIGVSGGYSFLPGNRNESIVFDTNGDGAFGDTVSTSAGANAFTPGFCSGSALTNVPGNGCRGDEDGETWGAHAGWDLQSGQLVYGAVIEVARANGRDAVSAFSTTPASYVMSRRLETAAQLRGRIGYAHGRGLWYVTGGAAYASFYNGFATTNTANAFTSNGEHLAWGWVGGVGAEYLFTSRFTLGVLARYARYQGDDFMVNASRGTAPATNPFVIAPAGSVNFQRSEDGYEQRSVVVTLNYRFSKP